MEKETKRLSPLPIGNQDFTDIRENGFCYVDKTERIYQMITSGPKVCFLSRPRRFGKSLLCSTLEAIFEGRRELFKKIAGQPALAIDSMEWTWKKHPVIMMDLNAEVYSNGVEALHNVLHDSLQEQAEKLEIELNKGNAISQFKFLIRKAKQKYGEKAVEIGRASCRERVLLRV
jgi:hypothetical protein